MPNQQISAVSPTDAPEQPIAPITGVATGSYGTASNLDDTQVFSTDDMAPDQRADGIPIDDPPPVDAPPPVELPAQDPPIRFPGEVPVDLPGETPPPMEAPRHEPGPIDLAAVVPTRPRRRTAAASPSRRPVAWAGFAAAAVVAVLVGVVLGVSGTAADGPGAGSEAAGPLVTAAPTTDAPGAGGGGGGGGGKDKSGGKGSGNGGNGNGNGN